MEAAFFDRHAHRADDAFSGDRDAVIARARNAGAAGIVCIGASVEQAHDSARIAQANPGFVTFTAGVHPHDAAAFDRERDITALTELVANGAVAIGECGLDYHYDNSPRTAQRAAFGAQIELAALTRRPLVVHTRDAEDDTAAMLREAASAGVRGVLHCYTGSHALAELAIDAGWYISFSGIVTFRKWDDVALVRLVPDNRLLVESDSPYLAPVPHRGQRNEPAWVFETTQRVAEMRGTDLATTSAAVIRNARTLFGLDGAP
jgi:TatD DNase family protein